MKSNACALLPRRATFAIVAVTLGMAISSSSAQEVQGIASPLANAHAHNDYEHTLPLFDALQHGFCSVEADIHCVHGELLVAHNAEDVKPDRTLEKLYLAPLRERLQANHGRIHASDAPFELFIDIKSDADTTYAVLDKTLAQYADLFVKYDHGRRVAGPIEVVVSGNRPLDTVTRQSLRFVSIDGRLNNLAGERGTHDVLIMPWISDRWTAHFTYDGRGAMSAEDLKKLDEMVRTAHRQGRRLRFWATPETPEMWRVLRDHHVDLINTDDLSGLAAFLRESP